MVTEKLFMCINSYLASCLPDRRGCSANTIKAYRTVMKEYLAYLRDEAKLPLRKLTFEAFAKNVPEFLDWIEKSWNCSIATRNHRFSAIRANSLMLLIFPPIITRTVFIIYCIISGWQIYSPFMRTKTAFIDIRWQ